MVVRKLPLNIKKSRSLHIGRSYEKINCSEQNSFELEAVVWKEKDWPIICTFESMALLRDVYNAVILPDLRNVCCGRNITK